MTDKGPERRSSKWRACGEGRGDVQWTGKGGDVALGVFSFSWLWRSFGVLPPVLGGACGCASLFATILANKTGCECCRTEVAVVTGDDLYTTQSYTSQMYLLSSAHGHCHRRNRYGRLRHPKMSVATGRLRFKFVEFSSIV